MQQLLHVVELAESRGKERFPNYHTRNFEATSPASVPHDSIKLLDALNDINDKKKI